MAESTRRRKSEAPQTELLLDLDRFRGMTKKQIRAWIEVDARALDTVHIGDRIIPLATELGITITNLDVERYAAQAATRGYLGVAEEWLAWGMRNATTDEARQRIRELLVRMKRFSKLEELGFALSADEQRQRIRANLEKLNDRYDDDRCERVLDRAVPLKSRSLLRSILAIAISYADHRNATRAAKAMGRVLTRRELLRIGRAKIRNADGVHSHDAYSYIWKHRLHELYATAIREIRLNWINDSTFAELVRWTTRFDIVLTDAMLLRFYQDSLGSDDEIAVAHELAKRNPDKWGHLVRESHERMRAVAINYRDPKSAERHGKCCGQPLTVAECLRIAEHLGPDTGPFSKRRAYCYDLATKRIVEQLKATAH
ncbi:MAG: hypothetical protein ABIG71_04120 [Candidatus Uhrbacteria bacterium]